MPTASTDVRSSCDADGSQLPLSLCLPLTVPSSSLWLEGRPFFLSPVIPFSSVCLFATVPHAASFPSRTRTPAAAPLFSPVD